MIFSFWIEFRGAMKLWVASIGFALIGANILFVLPPLFVVLIGPAIVQVLGTSAS